MNSVVFWALSRGRCSSKLASSCCEEKMGFSSLRSAEKEVVDFHGDQRKSGLHLTAHAGESMGPESVWAALGLGAERIGHGIAAARDEELMRHLRDPIGRT